MTKKITLLLLLVSMMVPMTLSAQESKKDILTDMKAHKDNSSLLKKNVAAPANKQMQKFSSSIVTLPRAPKAAPSADAVIWDFESEAQFNQWTNVDKDNDGHVWEYFNNEGKETGLMTAHEGYGLVASASYDNDSGAALSPDNWLISPEVTLGGVLSFWACGQDGSYCDEVFGVFVCVGNSTDYADFVQVGTDKTATGEMTEYSFDLSQYAGQTGRFAIRHYNCTDQFWLNIDDVCLDINATYVPDPTDPTNLTADPAATTADVAWDGAEGDSWNLRYKVYNPDDRKITLWDFTVDNYQSLINEGWYYYDMDQDGNNWMLSYGGYDPTGQTEEDNNAVWCSYSWYNEALSPDNWLITPDLTLGGTFKFWAQNDQYPDVLGVYVVTDEGIYQIGDDITPPQVWTEYSFDTSEFDGLKGAIAIRHYNCSDQFSIYVDYLSYEEDFGEWIEVNGLTDPNYTIEGLEPGTDYMVEVQAYTGKGTTDWSKPTYFTTLEEEDDVYVTLDETSSDNSGVISANSGETCNVILTRSIAPGTYNTLCLPFDVDNDMLKATFGDDVELAQLSDTHMDGETLYFDFAPADAITAGTPYLIYVSAAVESPITFNDVTVKEGTQTVTTSLANFIPVFDVTTLDNGNENILFLGANNTLYYPSTTSGAMKGFRADFELTGEAQGAKAVVVLGNSQTGVRTVLDGQAQDGYVYDLQGRMVSNPVKGVYIVNGKKVIIK